MSSLSVRFFNSFKSKYLNFFFYLFDCQVSCVELPRLVGLDGLEPSTSRLSGARSSHLSYRPLFPRWFRFSSSRGSSSPTLRSKAGRPFGLLCSLRAVIGCDTVAGGDDGVRTHDPLLAGQVLSQLSYTPIFGFVSQDP